MSHKSKTNEELSKSIDDLEENVKYLQSKNKTFSQMLEQKMLNEERLEEITFQLEKMVKDLQNELQLSKHKNEELETVINNLQSIEYVADENLKTNMRATIFDRFYNRIWPADADDSWLDENLKLLHQDLLKHGIQMKGRSKKT